MTRSFDVVVIGGGPGGSVCAAQLAAKGLRVGVFEKEHFPRFHLGESLLPQSLPVLAEIGVLPELFEHFIVKHGARFHDDVRGRKDRFAFRDAWAAEPNHAFEVPRDRFDQVLLRHAAKRGAEVSEQVEVTRILREGTRVVGVETRSVEGVTETVRTSFVVDATGRDAMTAHAGRTTTKIDGLDQTAFFAHFEGIPRPAGDLAGDIDIVLFREGDGERPNWFWFIPFQGGVTSVGAVVSRAWIKDRRAKLEPKSGEDATALFWQAVAESKTAKEMLASATMLWPRPQATADFSYRVRDIRGDGWLAIGDAAGFIDPLFSTGAHLAMTGGKMAADALVEALANPSVEGEVLAAWEEKLRRGAETFILAVRAFYAGPLVEYLFAENKHTALRRSITSLLAGDVFHDGLWLRDARRRLLEMTGDAPPSSVAAPDATANA